MMIFDKLYVIIGNILLGDDPVSNLISWIIVIIAFIYFIIIMFDYITQKKAINRLKLSEEGLLPEGLDDSYHISASTAMVLCTLFGLIGTFYGMTDALTSIFQNISQASGDEIAASKEFISKAKALLGGMGTAFGTSLIGIFCSIVLSICSAIINYFLNKNFQKAKEKFSKVIDPYYATLINISQKMPQSSQDDMLKEVKAISHQFNRLFLHLSQKEESAINALLEQLKKEILIPMAQELRKSNENSTMIQTSLYQFSAKINEQMQATQSNIDQLVHANQAMVTVNHNILKNHQQITQDQQQFLNSLKLITNDFKGLEQVFKNVALEIKSQMQGLTTEVTHQLNHAFQMVPATIEKTRLEQQKALEDFRIQYQASFQNIYTHHERSVSLLANKLKAFLDQSQQNFEIAIQKMAENVSARAATLLNEASDQVKESLAAVPNMLNQTTTESINLMKLFVSDIQKQFTQHKQEFTVLFAQSNQAVQEQQIHLKQVSQEIKNNLTNSRNEFELAFKEMSKNVAEEAAKLLANASDELEKGLQSVPNLLVQTRKETIEELTVFKNTYREELSVFFTKQAQNLNLQRKSFEDLHQSIEASLQKVRQDFEHVLGEVAVKVVEHASTMLQQASQEVENGLRAVPEMLERTRIETQAELSKFREEYQHRLNEFFSAQNEVLDETLGKHRENLSRVIVELQNTFAQEASRRAELYIQMNGQLKDLQEHARILTAMNTALTNSASSMLPQISMASQEIGKQLEKSYDQNTKLQEHIALLHKQFQDDIHSFGMSVGKITAELNGLINKSDQYAAQLIDGLIHSSNLVTQKIEELQQLSKIKS